MATTHLVKENTLLWVPAAKTSNKIFDLAKVIAIDEFTATCRTEDAEKRIVTLDLSTTTLMLANGKVENDMTSLAHIHEAGILYNLEQRSLKSEPYTMIGSVLVSTNPLRPIPNPTTIGTKAVLSGQPHPYCIAENAFQQMVFETSKELLRGGELSKANQSVVIGGESGAGKTENAKMVLSHLVLRASHEDKQHGEGLAERLLGTNPILEAFGNATTSRNPNSSRFGKLLRLNYEAPTIADVRKGGEPNFHLRGATVKSYLLERSRVVFHEAGERNYHIFHILSSAGKTHEELQNLKLEAGPSSFKYLHPPHPREAEQAKRDADGLKEIIESMDHVGMSKEERRFVFETVAAVLQMGNIEFGEKQTNEGNVAFVSNAEVLGNFASMLGVEASLAERMMCERKIEVQGKVIVTPRNAKAAAYARDAVAKSIYSTLFDWIIKKIDNCLMQVGVEEKKLTVIAVLDIFGFESFVLNGFEQLLINYTNEALQGTFNNQIFVAEAALYQKEGLFGSEEYLGQPIDNGVCIELLQGEKGLMLCIDNECKVPEPSDVKMIQKLHAAFDKHPCMVKVHPKDKAQQFIVRHYAGVVTYTVGTFVEKNSDKLPDDVDQVLRSTSKPLLVEMLNTTAVAPDKSNRKPPTKSIIHKFVNQIKTLISDLEATKCLFIRCLKPNASMVRDDKDPSWFDRKYVTGQLEALNVPQTAEVLRNGFPTRLEYSALVDSYGKLMPDAALKLWKASGNEPRGFVRALFWSFEVSPEIFKLGLTRVFFKGGQLTVLDSIMANSKADDKVVKRFKFYYVRIKWRRAAVIARSQHRMVEMFHRAHKRALAAARIQAMARAHGAFVRYNKLKRGALVVQKLHRGRAGRKQAAKRRLEYEEEVKRKLEAMKQKAEEAEKMKALLAEQARRAKVERERMERESKKAVNLSATINKVNEGRVEELVNRRTSMALLRESTQGRKTTVMKAGDKNALMLRGGNKLKARALGEEFNLPPPPPMATIEEGERRKEFLKDLVEDQKASFMKPVEGYALLKLDKESKARASVNASILSKLTGGKKWIKVFFVLDKPKKKLHIYKEDKKTLIKEAELTSKSKLVKNAEESKAKPYSCDLVVEEKKVLCVLCLETESKFRKLYNDIEEAKIGQKKNVVVETLSGEIQKVKTVDMKKLQHLNLLLGRKKITQKEYEELVKQEKEFLSLENLPPPPMEFKIPPLPSPFANVPYHEGKLSVQAKGVSFNFNPVSFEDHVFINLVLQYEANGKVVEWTVAREMKEFAYLSSQLATSSLLEKNVPSLKLVDNLNEDEKAIQKWMVDLFKMCGPTGLIDELLPPPPPYADPDNEDPDNWKVIEDRETKDVYYRNIKTCETRSKDPFNNGVLLRRFRGEGRKEEGKLSKGWEEIKDADGDVYYMNTQSGETTWTRPVDVAPEKKAKPLDNKLLLKLQIVREFFNLVENVSII